MPARLSGPIMGSLPTVQVLNHWHTSNTCESFQAFGHSPPAPPPAPRPNKHLRKGERGQGKGRCLPEKLVVGKSTSVVVGLNIAAAASDRYFPTSETMFDARTRRSIATLHMRSTVKSSHDPSKLITMSQLMRHRRPFGLSSCINTLLVSALPPSRCCEGKRLGSRT